MSLSLSLSHSLCVCVEQYLIIINYVAIGPSHLEGVKTFSRSTKKRENAKALCAIIHPISGYLLRPSGTFSFLLSSFFLAANGDQRVSTGSTDRRFDRSNIIERKGKSVSLGASVGKTD